MVSSQCVLALALFLVAAPPGALANRALLRASELEPVPEQPALMALAVAAGPAPGALSNRTRIQGLEPEPAHAATTRSVNFIAGTPGSMIEQLVQSVVGRPTRLRNWVWAILSALTVATIAVAVGLAMQHSRARSEDRPRLSSINGEVHPLLVRAGASSVLRGELHPESTFVEDIAMAFTKRRMAMLFLCTGLCCCIAEFVDERNFAIDEKVSDVASQEDCMWHCRNNVNAKHALCEAVSFKEDMCPWDLETHACVKKEEDKIKGVEYVRTPKCSYQVVPPGWKVDLVLCVAIMGIFLIVEGFTAELILIGMGCLFACCGIITPKDAFSGLASDGVVGLAFLFPVAAAVEETGVLDIAVGLMLGNPKSFYVALFRMMLPVAFLSAFLSNTAIVTMMIPVIVSWARRLNVSTSKLLMPLSFAAQLGGSCTLIGSSHCLVAKSSVDWSVYKMGFFDLSPAGALLSLATFGYMVLCLPLLGSSTVDSQQSDQSTEAPASPAAGGALYVVDFAVTPGSSQVGMAKDDLRMQLERLPGVKAISIEGCTEDGKVDAGSVAHSGCTDEGIVGMRRVAGLIIGNNEDLQKMGMGFDRRYRHLYEVVVKPESALLGQPMDADAMRQVLGACPVALRGKEPAPSQLSDRETEGAAPVAGDVLLLEADERFVATTEWMREFSVTKKVDHSSPQRVGGVHDRLRCVTVCLGMLAFCVLQAKDVVGISNGAGLFVALLVLTNAMTMGEVYSKIKAPVLLTIAGASALSAGLQASGIANFAAGAVTKVALPYGRIGIQLAIYLLSCGLSMFMNNSATIAILGPMLGNIAIEMEGCVSVKSLLFVTVFAAGTCLTTPLGYQTNLMVMKDGGYAFGDFTKYGAPIQVLHMITCVAVVNALGY